MPDGRRTVGLSAVPARTRLRLRLGRLHIDEVTFSQALDAVTALPGLEQLTTRVDADAKWPQRANAVA